MAFKDCILDHVKQGRLTAGQADSLLKKYDNLTEQYIKAGTEMGAADKAAQDIVQVETDTIIQKQRNEIQHALKQKEINDLLDSQDGKINKKVEDLYSKASRRGETTRGTIYSFMNKVSEKIKPDFLELKRDHKTFEAAVRHVLGETAEDADVRELGNVIKQVFDYTHSRYKTSGGILGKIQNYFPQVHRAEAIRKVDKDEWIDFTLERVDKDKMIDAETGQPFTNEKLREVLSNTYDDIVTGGASSLVKRIEAGKGAPKGRSRDVALKRQTSRFIHFKNADSYLEYNTKFGTGEQGLTKAFLSHVDSMSKDIGMLEVLGPKPDSMSRFLDMKMRSEKASSANINWVNAQYRVMRGLGYTDAVDSIWWKMATIPQNIIRSAVMGSASLSALSDPVFLMATSKINGLSSTRAIKNYVKFMSPFKNEVKDLAERAGLIVDTISGSTLSDTRFAGEMLDGKLTRYLAGIVNKLSGLDAMTRATKDGIAIEALSSFGDQIAKKISFDKLDPDFKAMLKRGGIDSKDWDSLLKADIYKPRKGVNVLITNEMRVSNKLDTKTANNVANKVDDLVNDLRQMAANESNLATRAITSGAIFGTAGAGATGSISRATASNLFMLKTFPITVINTHLLPAIRRARVQKKYDHLMMVTVGTTLLGGMVMQLKDMVKGKTPKEMDDHKFWLAALLQGGGLGLFGDFFLQDRSRFGRGIGTEIGGPALGLIDDVLRTTKGNFDRFSDGKDPNFLRDVFRLVKRNTPLSSLWYGRLVLERLLLDNIERMVDPNFDKRVRRMERKMRKESGQRFWWKPGE